jgi:hypothetical protein
MAEWGAWQRPSERSGAQKAKRARIEKARRKHSGKQ